MKHPKSLFFHQTARNLDSCLLGGVQGTRRLRSTLSPPSSAQLSSPQRTPDGVPGPSLISIQLYGCELLKRQSRGSVKQATNETMDIARITAALSSKRRQQTHCPSQSSHPSKSFPRCLPWSFALRRVPLRIPAYKTAVFTSPLSTSTTTKLFPFFPLFTP